MPHSTASRIALAYSLLFALATAVLGAAVYLVAHRALARQFDDRVSTEMSSLVSEYRAEGERGLHGVIRAREMAHVTNDLAYGLFRPDGQRVAGSIETARPKPGWQTLAFYDPKEGDDTARAYAIDIAPDRRLVVAADRDTLDQLDALILSLLAAALAAVVVLGTLGAIVLTAHLRARLSVISAGAEKIIAGDLAQRIPISDRRDEFDRVATVLNAMLDRIAALLTNLQQVSADVAHDLRLPLTRMRNQLERGLEDGQPLAALEQAMEQTDQVLALFASILRLSEIEAGQLRKGFKPVDLGRLAGELGESYAPAIEDGGRPFSARVTETPPIDGDRELLAQAIINLLDNAIAHTPRGTRILLSVTLAADVITVSVADNGLGVEERDRARIADRFVRLEASRHSPGHGLGLSLVTAIARIHRARLVFRDNQPGLVAALEFPR